METGRLSPSARFDKLHNTKVQHHQKGEYCWWFIICKTRSYQKKCKEIELNAEQAKSATRKKYGRTTAFYSIKKLQNMQQENDEE